MLYFKKFLMQKYISTKKTPLEAFRLRGVFLGNSARLHGHAAVSKHPNAPLTTDY